MQNKNLIPPGLIKCTKCNWHHAPEDECVGRREDQKPELLPFCPNCGFPKQTEQNGGNLDQYHCGSTAKWQSTYCEQQQTINELDEKLSAAQKEIDTIKAALADPAAVWVNMLRGTIARPIVIEHLEQTNRLLEANVAEMRGLIGEVQVWHKFDNDCEKAPCAWCEQANKLTSGQPLLDEVERLRKATTWQPIETAPKDGSEILVWREDAGWLLARWIAPCDFLHEKELEQIKDPEEPDWFYADFITGGRLDGGNPTHWMPLPDKALAEHAKVKA